MTEFFVMSCEGIYPSSRIGRHPSLPRGPWMTGQPITYEVPTPLGYELDADYPGELLPMYKSAAPLMRDNLLDVLSSCGVTNLQLFDAILTDPRAGDEHRDYKAVNVIGAVKAADLAASKLMPTSNSTLIDADFDRLAFRQGIPGDLLIFRLAESVNAIVVNELIKTSVESARIPGMTFFASGEWSG
jgi:hypothetical protein